MSIEMPTFNEPLKAVKRKRSGKVISRKSTKLGLTLPTSNSSNSTLVGVERLQSKSKRVQQRNALKEGAKKSSSTDHKLRLEGKVEEVIGDSQLNTIRREELVQQTKAKCASLKGVLVEKGIHTCTVTAPKKNSTKKSKKLCRRNSAQSIKLIKQKREEFVRKLSSNVRPTYHREVLLEHDFLEDTEIPMETSLDMQEIIRDIDRFTATIDTNPQRINWQNFHFNLLKIHRYYMDNTEDMDSDAEVEFNVLNAFVPLKSIIRGGRDHHVEQEIKSFDLKTEDFYRKYNQTLLDREQAFNDMMAVQSMSHEIAQKLCEIEMDMRESRQELQQGVQNK